MQLHKQPILSFLPKQWPILFVQHLLHHPKLEKNTYEIFINGEKCNWRDNTVGWFDSKGSIWHKIFPRWYHRQSITACMVHSLLSVLEIPRNSLLLRPVREFALTMVDLEGRLWKLQKKLLMLQIRGQLRLFIRVINNFIHNCHQFC